MGSLAILALSNIIGVCSMLRLPEEDADYCE